MKRDPLIPFSSLIRGGLHLIPGEITDPRAYDPPYYVPGGFCLKGQSPAVDYDVVPDLSACADARPPRKSPSRLSAIVRLATANLPIYLRSLASGCLRAIVG